MMQIEVRIMNVKHKNIFCYKILFNPNEAWRRESRGVLGSRAFESDCWDPCSATFRGDRWHRWRRNYVGAKISTTFLPNENQDFVEEKIGFELKLYRLTKSRALNSNF